LGGRFQILMVLNLFRLQGVKLIISAVGGVAVLGIYELAFKLLSLAISVPRAVIAPMMPAFASLLARGREARMKSLLSMAHKILGVAALLPLAFLAVFAGDVIRLWVGESFPLAAWSLRVLLAGVFVQQMTGVASSILRARAVLRYELQAQLLTVVLLGVAIVPVGLVAGYQGMVVTILVSQVIGYGWFLLRFNRLEAMPLRSFFRDALALPALAVVPLAVLMAVVRMQVMPDLAGLDRWRLAGWLAIYGSMFAALVALLGWRLTLSGSQRRQLISMFKTDAEHGAVNHQPARMGA
jgi:O-antigen/teichoic acid export membrane protein